MTAKEILCDRDKQRLRQQLSAQIFGVIPEKPTHLTTKFLSEDKHFAAGKAVLKRVDLICDFEGKTKEIPLSVITPTGKETQKFIVYLSYDSNAQGKYLPCEEIIDRGYALVILDHGVIAKCDGDFKSGICSHIKISRKRKDAPSKIALWAWGIMRVMDYLCDLDYVDKDRITVAAHSMLGKAALLACAFDERIKIVIANDSLNMGFAIPVDQVAEEHPYLFCPRHTELVEIGETSDDHGLLLKLCADRKILVGVAEDDPRSNPEAELKHLKSLIAEGYSEDNLHYHSRRGSHYLSRDDWNAFLDDLDNI
jgi:hypothetical protein